MRRAQRGQGANVFPKQLKSGNITKRLRMTEKDQ